MTGRERTILPDGTILDVNAEVNAGGILSPECRHVILLCALRALLCAERSLLHAAGASQDQDQRPILACLRRARALDKFEPMLSDPGFGVGQLLAPP